MFLLINNVLLLAILNNNNNKHIVDYSEIGGGKYKIR